MSKKWLIDAHNVIHQIPDLSRKLPYDALSSYTGFCRLVQQQCSIHKKRARIVFDGNPLILPEKFHLIEIFYSRERTADEVIMNLLRKEGASSKWMVVTDDREIRQKAYYHHVEIIRTKSFISLPYKSEPANHSKPAIKSTDSTIDPGKRANPHVDEEEVDELLKLFNEAKKNRD